MKEEELRNIVHQKNELIIRQTRRISQLEQKLAEVRHKYFELKYDGDKMGTHPRWA
jgi:hypothetical protein